MVKYLLLALCACTFAANAQVLDPHEISQSEATKLIGAFQSSNTLSGWNLHAGTLPKETIIWLMNRKDAATLTYYWGLDEQNQLQVLYVASKADGSNILDTDAILCPRRLTLHTDMSASNILSVKEATTMMKRYRQSELFKKYSSVFGGRIGRSSIIRLTEQKNTVGIRSYFALTATSTPALVFVGTTASASDNTVLFEDRGRECPPDCGKVSQLVQLSSQP